MKRLVKDGNDLPLQDACLLHKSQSQSSDCSQVATGLKVAAAVQRVDVPQKWAPRGSYLLSCQIGEKCTEKSVLGSP